MFWICRRLPHILGNMLKWYGMWKPIPCLWAALPWFWAGGETSSKEYLPFPALLGGILNAAEKESDSFQMLIPSTQGAEADGQYPWAVEAVLANRGLERVTLVSPELETLPENIPDPDLLFRAVLAGDLILCAPPEQRSALSPDDIPNWDSLSTLAAQIGSIPVKSQPLAAVGEPLSLRKITSAPSVALR